MACEWDDCKHYYICDLRIDTGDSLVTDCDEYVREEESPETPIGYKTEVLAKLVAEGEFPCVDTPLNMLEVKLREVLARKASVTGYYWVCECKEDNVHHITDRVCSECRAIIEDGTGRYATVKEAATFLLPKVIELTGQARSLLDEAMIYMHEIGEL